MFYQIYTTGVNAPDQEDEECIFITDMTEELQNHPFWEQFNDIGNDDIFGEPLFSIGTLYLDQGPFLRHWVDLPYPYYSEEDPDPSDFKIELKKYIDIPVEHFDKVIMFLTENGYKKSSISK